MTDKILIDRAEAKTVMDTLLHHCIPAPGHYDKWDVAVCVISAALDQPALAQRPAVPSDAFHNAVDHLFDEHGIAGVSPAELWEAIRPALAQQPAVPPEKEPSPTAGMNIAQRILHVGGRNNAAGYVEFGSIQAVQALVRQVLRDIHKPRLIPDHELVTMYDECPRSDSEMLEFAHNVMGAMLNAAPGAARDTKHAAGGAASD